MDWLCSVQLAASRMFLIGLELALRNTLASTNVLLVLDALEIAAEPNRRRLLHLLARREQAVGELAAHFTVSRSAVSQHLLLLEQAGLVAARKEGETGTTGWTPGEWAGCVILSSNSGPTNWICWPPMPPPWPRSVKDRRNMTRPIQILLFKIKDLSHELR
ncbi:transcriptional repressor SdpR [Arthrobacter sp. Hiyo4]|nr:transcriptional repressor SdpR [Arthrobacter sp. Hiyo4]